VALVGDLRGSKVGVGTGGHGASRRDWPNGTVAGVDVQRCRRIRQRRATCEASCRSWAAEASARRSGKRQAVGLAPGTRRGRNSAWCQCPLCPLMDRPVRPSLFSSSPAIVPDQIGRRRRRARPARGRHHAATFCFCDVTQPFSSAALLGLFHPGIRDARKLRRTMAVAGPAYSAEHELAGPADLCEWSTAMCRIPTASSCPPRCVDGLG
jgi:hypothetical protein